MLTKLISLLPVPIKLLLRGVLSPVIGFRVVADWRTAVQRSNGYESAETLGVFENSNRTSTHSDNFVSTRYLQMSSAILSAIGQGNPSIARVVRVLDVGGDLVTTTFC